MWSKKEKEPKGLISKLVFGKESQDFKFDSPSVLIRGFISKLEKSKG